MTLPRLREVANDLYGAWRFARFDRSAMACFETGIDAVWRSFWAAALAYPGFILLLVLRLEPAQRQGITLVHILVLESIGYVILWAAFPLVILAFCRWLGREEQALDFIIAYNWWQVLQAGLFVAAALAGAVLPPAAPLFDLVAGVAAIGCEWFIARTVLAAGGMVAVAVVLMDIVLSAGMQQLTQTLY